jgi:hypothetical protein
MPLVIKSEDGSERTPHLALTHKKLQGGSANNRNVSLLMKSDAEMTEDVIKAIAELGVDDFSVQAETAGDSVTLEPSGDTAVDVEKSNNEVILLQEEIQKAVEAAESVLKAQLVEKETALQKALEEVSAYKVEKEQVVTKARKDAIAEVEKDEAKADELFKSLEVLSQEAFDVVIKSLKAKDQVVEDSDLFVQKSKNSDLDVEEESGTAAILKAKYATK